MVHKRLVVPINYTIGKGAGIHNVPYFKGPSLVIPLWGWLAKLLKFFRIPVLMVFLCALGLGQIINGGSGGSGITSITGTDGVNTNVSSGPFTISFSGCTVGGTSSTWTITCAGGASHNLLSSTHSDTTAAAAVRGDGIFAIGATPTWQRLAHPTVTGGYFKWNGTDVVASTLAAAGTGTPTACSNQFVTSLTLAADAAPTSTCTTATLASAQFANQGTTATLLHGNAAGNPTFGAVNLASEITGQLPIGSVGSGGLTGASPITINSAGAIACASCVVNNAANSYTGGGLQNFGSDSLKTTGFYGSGVTPSWPLDIEQSVAGDKVAVIQNSSATGSGLQIIPGNDSSNYALAIANAANSANNIRLFGDGSFFPVSIQGITFVDGVKYTTIDAAMTALGTSTNQLVVVPSSYAGADPTGGTSANLTVLDLRGGTHTWPKNFISVNQSSASGLHAMLRPIQSRFSPSGSDVTFYSQGLYTTAIPANSVLEGGAAESDLTDALTSIGANAKLIGFEAEANVQATGGLTMPDVRAATFNGSSSATNTTNITTFYDIVAQPYVKGGSETVTNAISVYADAQTAGSTKNLSIQSVGVAEFDAAVNALVGVNTGSSPPACVAGTAGFMCNKEGTAPTNVASTATIYPSSTTHEYMGVTNGASTATPGMMVRSQPGALSHIGSTATISTETVCAASAGACNVAGQYHVHLDMWESGTACTSITTGSVAPTLTWTDRNGTSHAAVPFRLITQASGTALAATFIPVVSALTAFASADMDISTNGTVIQDAFTYIACTTGTLTYNADVSVTRYQ